MGGRRLARARHKDVQNTAKGFLESGPGIEPGYPRPQRGVLPLNYPLG